MIIECQTSSIYKYYGGTVYATSNNLFILSDYSLFMFCYINASKIAVDFLYNFSFKFENNVKVVYKLIQ